MTVVSESGTTCRMLSKPAAGAGSAHGWQVPQVICARREASDKERKEKQDKADNKRNGRRKSDGDGHDHDHDSEDY